MQKSLWEKLSDENVSKILAEAEKYPASWDQPIRSLKYHYFVGDLRLNDVLKIHWTLSKETFEYGPFQEFFGINTEAFGNA